MEKIALISDVHSNVVALEAVLQDINAAGITQIWCLGDTVGYGPRPLECARLIQERCAITLLGNHDAAAIGKESLMKFNDIASEGALYSKNEMQKEPGLLAWLKSLHPQSTKQKELSIMLTHGSPHDSLWHYVLNTRDARTALAAAIGYNAVFVGHSHLQIGFEKEGEQVYELNGGKYYFKDEVRTVINPGSVGQPRDMQSINPRDARAGWGILCHERGRLVSFEWKRTEYDYVKTISQVQEAGLPSLIGTRLRPQTEYKGFKKKLF